MKFLDFLFKNKVNATNNNSLTLNQNDKKEREFNESFLFKSNCHQRYENGIPKMGLQKCIRTITIEKNLHGCPGYKLSPGIGYIIKIFNDDLNKPNMTDKPMKIVKQTDTSIEFRGFPVEAQSPFGWQEVDYSNYGFIVHYEHNKVSRCVLHMYDRDIFIVYKNENTKPLKKPNNNIKQLECEQYALLAREAAFKGNTSMAHQYGMKVFESIIKNKEQIKNVKDNKIIALSLGKLLEGNYFSDFDSVKKAVGLTYYFLCKSIKEENDVDPYLYLYRFSTVWEYNRVFYFLFAHSENDEYEENLNPFNQIKAMTYDHHMVGMQMSDALIEPKILQLDPAINNIFHKIYSQYNSTPPETIINIAKEYHEQIFNYLKRKIDNNDFNF